MDLQEWEVLGLGSNQGILEGEDPGVSLPSLGLDVQM